MPKLFTLFLLSLLFVFSSVRSQDIYRTKQIPYIPEHSQPLRNAIQNKRPWSAAADRKRQIENSIAPFKPFKTDGQCYDTSVRLIYRNDTLFTFNDFITATKDGNILIPGFDEHDLNDDYYFTAHILKCTPQGDTLWFKKIKSGYAKGFIDAYRAFELKDGSIILTGDMAVPVPTNDKQVPLIMKLSPQGNLIWEKTYESGYWNIDTTTGSVLIYDCKEDGNGDLYFCGNIKYWDSQPRAAITFKTNNNGNLLWSKGYSVGSRPTLAGMQIRNNTLQLLGYTYVDYEGQVIFGLSLDKTTGDSIYTKVWQMPYNDKKSYNAYAYIEQLTVADNGNYLVYGNTLGDSYNFDTTLPNTHHCILEFTPDLDFVKSTLFQSWQKSNAGNSVLSVFPDGSGAFSRLQYISGFSTNTLFGSFNKGQVIKERVISYRGRSNVWISNFLQLGSGGQIVTQSVGDSIKGYVGIELDKLHNSDTSAYCLGYDSSITQIVPGIPYTISNYFPYDSIKSKVLKESHRPFGGMEDANINIISGCEAISFCNKIKLVASADTICPSTPLFITVKKNKECGSQPLWNYDSSVIKTFTEINDSTFKVIFKTSWKGKIYASVIGCSGIVTDSVALTVLQAPPKLYLGPDTVICPGNTIILNAKSGYTSYTWQDGSSDSVFNVIQPGVYFVQAANACGGIFYDTVIVSQHPPIPLDIGSDTSLCNGDTLVVKAPSGFINYQWYPYYGISDSSAQTVKLYPKVTTQYNLSAEKTPGCFAYDSINITVNETPVVHIGNDTSFCNGDTLLLDAGSGFAKYLWNNGSTNTQIQVADMGTYSVIVTAQNNCAASDTMQVLNVYENPNVLLSKDSVICAGDVLKLDAGGGFASYLWQDGTTAQTYNASGTGMYYVLVTDMHGCMGSDTNIITGIAQLPSDFLTDDTAKCSYDTLVLQSNRVYNAYIWSTGSMESSIKITSPGNYWLQVTDINHCMQKEYTSVTEKQCYNAIYFPNAFTPNGDGLNDRFRPAVFGSLQQFKLMIYNRWGAKIFETSDWAKGWDGTVKNISQNNDSYVWIATYQLAGLQPVTQKGMVTIIK